MMQLLLKEMRAWREKMDAETRATQARTEATKARTEATKAETEVIKARTRAMREKMGASHMEMVSAFKPEIEEETMACRETMEAHQEEEKLTSPDGKPEAAQKAEVPAENATVMLVGEPKKKRHRDRKLATERRRQKPKTSNRENCRPQKRLAVARSGKVTRHRKEIDRKMSRCTTVARRKTDIVRKNLTQGAGGFPRKRLVMADKMTHCLSMAEHKRLRPQGDQSDPRTSLHKDVLERAREELGSRKAIRLETAK
jgi:hypothetical protein